MTVYATGCDFAFQHPDYAQLVPGGYTFSVRYLYPPGQTPTRTKNLTKWEADLRWSYGNDTVSNYESWASRAGESPEYADGVADALAADQQHKACGGPPDRPIYFSIDFDTVSANDPGIGDYFRGIASVIGLYRTGAYGEYEIIKYLFDNNLIKWGWQTYAWSAGQFDERCQLAQDHNGLNFAGGNIDLDTAHAADFGQWHFGEEMAFTPDDVVNALLSKVVGNTGYSFGSLLNVLLQNSNGTKNDLENVILDSNHPQSLPSIKSKVDGANATLSQLGSAVQTAVTNAVASAVPVLTQAIKDGLPSVVDPAVVDAAVAKALPDALAAAEFAVQLQGTAGPKPVAVVPVVTP